MGRTPSRRRRSFQEDPDPPIRLAKADPGTGQNIGHSIQGQETMRSAYRYNGLDRHDRRYAPSRLRARLEGAGLEVITVRRLNMVGAVAWFVKGRLLRAQATTPGEISKFDRMVPLFRAVESVLRPPVGQS